MIFNTGESSEQLREKYNPEGSHLREVQRRMFEMLLYLDDVCSKIGVKFRLEGGTFLGAVRHEDFIPWDDDVDIAFDNKDDWEKLRNYLLNNPHPQYRLQDENTDPGFINYWYTLRDTNSEYIHEVKSYAEQEEYRKYRGLQIDVFLFVRGVIPALYKFDKKYSRLVNRYLFVRHHYVALSLHRFQRIIIHPFFYFLSSLFGDKTTFMHAYGASFMPRFKESQLFPYRKYKFMNSEFWGPNDKEGYLKEKYGDYMNLPPMEGRRHHKVKIKIW